MCIVRSKMLRSIEIIAAMGVFILNFEHAQSQPVVTQDDRPNRVVIEYVRPQNTDLWNSMNP
jgi:hypothetical protein